jgi:outer membrane protein assembly factor BamB
VAGISQERTPSDSKSWVIRLAHDGATLWKRLSENAGSNEAWGAAPTPDGGVVVVSAAQYGGLGESDARLVRFAPDGEIIWSRIVGGRSWTRPTAVITTRDGGILVTGYTTGRGAGYQDVWVVRLDGEGRLNRR